MRTSNDKAARDWMAMIAEAKGEVASACAAAAGHPCSAFAAEIRLLATDLEATIGAADNDSKPAQVTILAYSGGVMSPENWQNIIIDLDGADLSATTPVLASHNDSLSSIVGQGQATVQRGELIVRGTITTATPAGQQVIALHRDGIDLQASIGYQPEKIEQIPPGQSVQANGRTFEAGPAGLTVARSGRLREVSLLPVGADSETHVSISAKGNTMGATSPHNQNEQFDEYLQGAWEQRGLSNAERIQARWDNERWHERDPGEGPYQRAHAAMLAAASGRITFNDFEKTLLVEKARDSELALIFAERPQGPGIRSSSYDANPLAIEASLCRSAGLKDMEKHFKPEVLEAADRAFSGGVGLQETLLIAAAANGYSGRQRISAGNIREVLQAAYGGGIQAAGLSKIDVSGILSNTANKLLLDGFASVENVWADISKITPLKDFKDATRYRLTADLEYEELAKGGDIEHGTLG